MNDFNRGKFRNKMDPMYSFTPIPSKQSGCDMTFAGLKGKYNSELLKDTNMTFEKLVNLSSTV